MEATSTNRPYVSWVRVSTKGQGESGLGLEAQRAINRYYMSGEEPIAEFVEVYSGTKLDQCEELWKAIRYAKANNALLVIAKADRFRDVVDALRILDEMGEGNIVFCDSPGSSRLILTILFSVYEHQARIGRINTKLALGVRKKQCADKGGFVSRSGVYRNRLGRPDVPESHLAAMREASAISRRNKRDGNTGYKNALLVATDARKRGATLQEICDTLNAMNDMTPPRGGKWSIGQVSRMLNNS